MHYLDNPRDFPERPVDRAKVESKLGWLRGYRADLARWAELHILTGTTEHYVRHEGYHPEAKSELAERLKPLATCRAGRRMRVRLLKFVRDQSAQAGDDERLLGSSEVLESLNGKYKQLQHAHSKGGMTAMVLSFGAIVVEKSAAVIQNALETVKTQDVYEWVKSQLGVTIQAQRKLAFEGTKPAHKKKALPKLPFEHVRHCLTYGCGRFMMARRLATCGSHVRP